MKETHMVKGLKILGLTAIVACGLSSQAFAQDKGCIALKSTAEVEQEVVNAKGEKSTKLVPLTKVVPGVEVIWTITANNICKQPSEKVSINDAVPEHMTYVANSAIGPGADIEFSVDGKTFAAADQLTVVESGASRKARADEYTAIRWNFKNSFAPGAQGFGRFRAILN
ncbi:MAG: hypothetical protein ABI769_15560 [Pseudomonadota bacterium]